MVISLKEIKKLLICIFIPLLIGSLSSLISILISGNSFGVEYLQLTKPNFAPPSIVFPIIWPILYILMGISFYIVMSSNKSEQKKNEATFLYYIQLALNFLWSIFFFGLNLRFVALIDIILLIVLVIAMIYKFYMVDKIAGLLNIPYLIWLIYAMVLNYFIFILN